METRMGGTEETRDPKAGKASMYGTDIATKIHSGNTSEGRTQKGDSNLCDIEAKESKVLLEEGLYEALGWSNCDSGRGVT